MRSILSQAARSERAVPPGATRSVWVHTPNVCNRGPRAYLTDITDKINPSKKLNCVDKGEDAGAYICREKYISRGTVIVRECTRETTIRL